jgi:hypothetical protein
VSAPAAVTPTPPEVAQVLCASGSLCGFGVFSGTTVARSTAPVAPLAPLAPIGPFASAQPQAASSTEAERFAFVSRFQVITPAPGSETPAGQPAKVALNAWEPASVRMRNEALNGGTLLADSGELFLVRDGGSYYVNDDETDVFYSDANSPNRLLDRSAEVARLEDGVFSYTTAGGTRTENFSGHWGVTTSAAGVAELQRGNAVVNYVGKTETGGAGSVVRLTVDFGAGRITDGSINNGADSGPLRGITPSGQSQLTGKVGMEGLKGKVEGSSFRINEMTARDGTVTGTVQGAFFGGQAQVAAGVIDVVKSRTDGSYTNARYVDSFIAHDAQKIATER